MKALRAMAHAAGLACFLAASAMFFFERWPALLSLRPAKVVGLNLGEKEMGALVVSDHSDRLIVVSADWNRVKGLRAGETVWVRDVSNRYGDSTGQGTVLEGPLFLPEVALLGAFLYLGWLALLARRRWNPSAQSSLEG